MKVYCSDCKYFCRGENDQSYNGYCTYPENIKRRINNFYEYTIADTVYLRKPQEINCDNECSWFRIKYKWSNEHVNYNNPYEGI